MRVKRSIESERDIAYVLKALDTMVESCGRYGASCHDCPWGKLGVFDTPTCDEISKLKSRLELVYKVVETL